MSTGTALLSANLQELIGVYQLKEIQYGFVDKPDPFAPSRRWAFISQGIDLGTGLLPLTPLVSFSIEGSVLILHFAQPY
jgi:hypothetical protein